MKTGFVTVCETTLPRHLPQCNTLAASLKEHSDFALHVYTYTHEFSDDVDEVVRIQDFTDAPPRLNTTFNYNLKGIVTNHMFTNNDYDQIVFVDCDLVMTSPTKAFEEELSEGDIWGNYSKFDATHRLLQSGAKFDHIVELLDISGDFFEAMYYFTETMLVINRSNATAKFLNNWARICEAVSATNINPCYESVELGMALHQTKADLDLRQLRTTSLKTDKTFLTDHRDKFIDVIS